MPTQKRTPARERMRRRVMYLARTVEPLRPYGYGPGRGHKSPKNRRKVYAKGGNRNRYLAARIARDRPDVLERMKRGEFDTVQAAALEAGIVKSKVSGPTTKREETVYDGQVTR
jgi:hypothetical protein